jgi:predicted DNA-binding transcriptional regulator YafY
MADINRIQWLHKKIVELSYPNAMRLAEKFSISHRQAQREVVFLRDYLHAPLKYDMLHKGFYYSEPFELPAFWLSSNEEGYYDLFSNSEENQLDGENSLVQMQIPYSARIKVADKLTALEFRNFIRKNEGGLVYVCEFQSVEKFLGAIMMCESDVELIEPLWMRERLIESAKRIMKNHSEIEE